MLLEKADKNGKITFSSDKNTKPFRTLEFFDARLINYNEDFKEKGNNYSRCNSYEYLGRISINVL
jgi:hypothetical protein